MCPLEDRSLSQNLLYMARRLAEWFRVNDVASAKPCKLVLQTVPIVTNREFIKNLSIAITVSSVWYMASVSFLFSHNSNYSVEADSSSGNNYGTIISYEPDAIRNEESTADEVEIAQNIEQDEIEVADSSSPYTEEIVMPAQAKTEEDYEELRIAEMHSDINTEIGSGVNKEIIHHVISDDNFFETYDEIERIAYSDASVKDAAFDIAVNSDDASLAQLAPSAGNSKDYGLENGNDLENEKTSNIIIDNIKEQDELSEEEKQDIVANVEAGDVQIASISSGASMFPVTSHVEAVADEPMTWEKFAVAIRPVPKDTYRIAIVIDDLGIDTRRTTEIMQLQSPMTLSFMTYANDLDSQTKHAKRLGHELMMHVPMEPLDSNINPGPGALKTSMSDEELKWQIEDVLNTFDGFVGINNHMGSKLTSDTRAMDIVMDELKKRGLLFIDSRTTASSVGYKEAAKKKIPYAVRHVFLDPMPGEAILKRQLKKLEYVASQRGYAIGIGHPRDATIKALQEWLPTLDEKRITLVPVSEIIKYKYALGELPGEGLITRASR
jgi:polysaccharide deacetylase 2 family uncharacterized protein YibQ